MRLRFSIGRTEHRNVSGYDAWSIAPIVDFDRDDRKLRLDGKRVGNRHRDYASPAFRERSQSTKHSLMWGSVLHYCVQDIKLEISSSHRAYCLLCVTSIQFQDNFHSLNNHNLWPALLRYAQDQVGRSHFVSILA